MNKKCNLVPLAFCFYNEFHSIPFPLAIKDYVWTLMLHVIFSQPIK